MKHGRNRSSQGESQNRTEVRVKISGTDPGLIAYGLMEALPESNPKMGVFGPPLAAAVMMADRAAFVAAADAAAKAGLLADLRRIIVGEADIRVSVGKQYDLTVSGPMPDLQIPKPEGGFLVKAAATTPNPEGLLRELGAQLDASRFLDPFFVAAVLAQAGSDHPIVRLLLHNWAVQAGGYAAFEVADGPGDDTTDGARLTLLTPALSRERAASIVAAPPGASDADLDVLRQGLMTAACERFDGYLNSCVGDALHLVVAPSGDRASFSVPCEGTNGTTTVPMRVPLEPGPASVEKFCDVCGMMWEIALTEDAVAVAFPAVASAIAGE